MQALNTFAAGDSNYIAKLNQDNAAIKAAIDALEALSGGSTNIQAAVVPKGLKYIFDRKGIIGKASYKPTAATLTGPNYSLTIASGGFWDGSALAYSDSNNSVSMSGKSTGTYYVTIDSSGLPAVYNTAGSGTVWQFSYNSSTHVVSNVTLYTGVAVLFDGADYADALTSAQLGLTFQSLADRLEEIESRLVEIGTYYQYDPATTSGLDFGFKSGKVRNDNLVWETPAGTVTLADDATNYLEVNPADGTVNANATGFTSGQIPLYEVVTVSGAITTFTDKRTWVAAGGGGGGGGGHTQNTDAGTTANAFKLNMDETGAPSADCKLEVERGTSANVALKWNETENKWQFTNDGANYLNIFDPTVQLAAQEFTKYVGLDDPPKVLEDLNRDSSADYETVDVSSYIAAPNGIQAMVLRVFFWDDAPAYGVNVKFKQKDAAAPAEAYTVWSDQYGSALVIIPVLSDSAFEYFVSASGVGTANLKVYLVGYMEKVSGVGTQAKTLVQTDLSVPANGTGDFTFDDFCNRGLVHSLKIEETSGNPTNVYDLHLYADDSFATLLYKAEGIIPGSIPFEDWLPFWVYDSGAERKLRVRIINHDVSQAGTYAITIKAEQFA